MIAVILAAGISSRLRPLTDSIPKSLLPIAGKPLLHRTLETLQRLGVHDCVIVTGYLREMIEQSVRNMTLAPRVSFVFNPNFETTNNNYSLWVAGPNVAAREMLLLDADILFDPRILERLLRSSHPNALVVRSSHDPNREEVKVELDPAGRVLQIGKDVDLRKAAGESIGIEKFSPSAARELFEVLGQRKHRNEFYEASFQELIDRGTDMYAVEAGDYPCIEIDTLEDLRDAERLAHRMQQ